MDQKDLKQIREILKDELDTRIDKLEKNLDKKMDGKFATYDKKMDSKFTAQDKKINVDIDSKLDKRIGELEQKMFEWKSEIVDVVDGLAKEIRDERKFRGISSHQTTDNSRRIDKLEKKVFGVAESGV